MEYPIKVEKYPGRLDDLAKDVGKMNYYKLANFLDYLGNDLMKQSKKDKENGRTQLASKLESVTDKIFQARDKVIPIAKLCQPYMKE